MPMPAAPGRDPIGTTPPADSLVGGRLRPVPLDHEILHAYFDFDDGCPHMQGVRAGRSNAYALFERGTGRIMTFATPGDLHCGWMCRYFGHQQDMQAIKMGINIVIYFLSH